MMTFKSLLADIPYKELREPEAQILGLTDDSREVRPGWAFVACRGLQADGHAYVAQALSRGATAIVAEKPLAVPKGVAFAWVRNTRAILGRLAVRFYDSPGEKLTLIGITGTNGKTSVAWFVRKMLQCCGRSSGLLGTIHYDLGRQTLPARETTPPVVRLHRYLAEMVKSGLSYAVMEVSSHALDQGRLDGTAFEVAVFTNLSRDHLDYHQNMEAYFATKRLFFKRYLLPQGKAVVNVSDSWGRRLAEELGAQAIRVGEGASLSGSLEARKPEGYLFSLKYHGKSYALATRLYGDFQLENLLLTVAVGLALDLSFEEVCAALSGVSAPPGRLELVARWRGALVFVDYAHTPEALESALRSLRPLVRGRLFCLFGCGGERDRGKRPLMGRVASCLADQVIVTSDNPRGEDPGAIVAEILKGVRSTPEVILDRREAIFRALKALWPGDVLLVAGKGHEDYQEIDGVRYPFSDREVIRDFVAREGK